MIRHVFLCLLLLAGILISCARSTPSATPATVSAGASPTAGIATVPAIASTSAISMPEGAATVALPAVLATPDRDLYGRVDTLLAEMTLEQKVGQLFLVYFAGPALSPALRQMIVDYHVGGILLFNRSGNIEGPRQLATLLNAAQQTAVENVPAIPLLVAIDQEGGPVTRLTAGFTVFPSNMALGATGSTEDATRMAAVMAAEMKATGINMNLAPVTDVNDNPDNPVIGIRAFGSSPELVARLGSAMIETYQAAGVIATAKHFPGHGNTDVDSHTGLPLVSGSLERLNGVELVPFRAAVDTGSAAIMTAHVLLPAIEPDAVPATLSHRVLQGLLREQMGYEGLIVTDSLGMGALDRTYGIAETAWLAFAAGADLLAFGADVGHTPADGPIAYSHVLEQVRAGAVPMDRLDNSVRRILLAKAQYGLLDWTPVDVETVADQTGTDAHRATALDIARHSITLVRNECETLPLSPDRSLLAVLPGQTAALGEYLSSHHSNVVLLPVGLDPSPQEIAQAVEIARTSSTVLVATANARAHPAQARLVEALSACPLVVAALESPYDLMAFPDAPAYVASYGSVPPSLHALTEVLFGVAHPTGRLPVELPGLYPVGHGIVEF